MTKDYAYDIFEKMNTEIYTLLTTKGDAYSCDKDVLQNFKNAAANLNMDPFQIWAVYFGKHVSSIFKAISDNPHRPVDKSEGFKSRLLDAAAYLYLAACLHAEIENQPDK